MIVINCINVRKQMATKHIDIESLRQLLEDQSHEVYTRLNNLYHCAFIQDRNIDMFIYRLAEALECSVDYILGYQNDPGLFILVNVSNRKAKEAEYSRLITKYATQLGLDIHNSNVLAHLTGVDRDIFDYLLRNPSGDTWITSSYYVLSHLAHFFGFDYESALNFVFDINTSPDNQQYITYLLSKYNQEYTV